MKVPRRPWLSWPGSKRFTVKSRESHLTQSYVAGKQLCCPKFFVKSPEMLISVAWNVILLSSIQSHDYTFIGPVSSHQRERATGSTHLSRLFHFIKAKRARYITHFNILLVSSHYRLKNEERFTSHLSRTSPEPPGALGRRGEKGRYSNL